MLITEIIGIIAGALVAVIASIRKFNIRHIKIKCLSGCCECEESMDAQDDEHEKDE
tara:strand:- start:2 stop:169 length:168 start_codon:yes stop_codon:yes gene_type:complete